MMKFIRKHTEGPWEKVLPGPLNDGFRVFSDSVYLGYFGHSDMPRTETEANADLCSQAPAMLDYLIERANKIESSISITKSSDVLFEAFGDELKEDEQELSRLIEIIRAAGVDVIE